MTRYFITIIILLTALQACRDQSALRVVTGETGTTVYSGEKPVVTYVHAETLPPEGIDPVYKRSAYIHPLFSPGGEILTRIQPPDHYHHYGIWNPWTKTRIDTMHVDFWNLAEGEGTVKFSNYGEITEEKGVAGFEVFHHHIYFPEEGVEKTAINEKWEVEVSPEEDLYIVDLTSTLNTLLPGGITLEAYRYGGGIGFRATEKWHRDNCTVLTSAGLTRDEADGTGARWCIVEGESSVPEGRSGILFLSHPSNRAHPEPMRVWPTDSNGGRGDMFFEFCPIRHQEWKLEQGKDYILKYRMVVFDGEMTKETTDNYWEEFSGTGR